MNRGDVHSPGVRCQLVAQEVNTCKEDVFFAATPPMDALRLVLCHVATGTYSRKIRILDAEKGHLHPFGEREMFNEVLPERWRQFFCGRLVWSLYGTRDAPSLSEKFAASRLEGLGFRGLASSFVFRHASRDLVAVLRGDDFVFAGFDADLAWAHCALEENTLLKKVGTLSVDAGDAQEIRVLIRVLHWTACGIAYEADPRHAELLIQASGPSASLQTTPGLKPTSGALGDQSRLSWAEARPNRASAGRANYLALVVWMWHSLPKSFAAV